MISLCKSGDSFAIGRKINVSSDILSNNNGWYCWRRRPRLGWGFFGGRCFCVIPDSCMMPLDCSPCYRMLQDLLVLLIILLAACKLSLRSGLHTASVLLPSPSFMGVSFIIVTSVSFIFFKGGAQELFLISQVFDANISPQSTTDTM